MRPKHDPPQQPFRWLEDLTWDCAICHETRPDDKINVLKKKINWPGVNAVENIKYCNDREACIEGAKTFTYFPVGSLQQPDEGTV